MKKKLNIKPKRESNIPERNMMQDSVRMPKAGYGGTTGMGTVPMMMFEHGGKFGSYDNRDTGYYKQGGYIWQTTPHMKHGGMPAYGQSFPEANWWGYRSSGPSQFTLPYQLDIKLPPPPEREGPIPTYRNEINSTDYDAATFKAGGRVRMKFRGENHEIYQDGDAVYVNHPDTKPGKDKSKWKKFNATKEVGAKTIGQAEHAIEEWHNANPGKYEFGGNVTTGQWAILDDDENDLPEAGSGYKVVRSSERKGKTHKVTGPDGTVKFFGDSKLGQHPKDPERKKAFYARHKKNLAGNPYFRAFARKTWEYGGEVTENDIPMAGDGKTILSYLNPKNWGVADYTNTGNFDSAYSTARKAGEKEFLYNGQRFNTRKDTDPIEYIGNNPNQGEYDKILRTQYPEFYKILNRGQNVGNISFEGASLAQPDRGFIKKNPNLLSSGNSKIAVGQNPSLQTFIGNLIAETGHLKDKNLDQSIFNPYTWKSRSEHTGLDDPTMYNIPGNMEYNTHRLFEPGIAMLAYGNLSPNDIKRIQKHLGVTEDGYFGENTYKALVDKYKDKTTTGSEKYPLVNPYMIKDYLKVLSKDVPIKDYKRFTSNIDAYPDYTDNALKNINIADNNSFDTYILQQTLNNRGYKLPKSIKEDGSFDGVLGDETKKALLDYQAKNKPYTQKAPLPGQSVPTMEFGKGGMIKRKDGSYSRRGLWDNIRANKGSGKKPTKEMLEQERKIKMKENKAGMGMRLDLNPLPVMPARSAGNGASLIDLHLPKYPDRRTQNLYATPYMFGLSPAKDVNVYGAGASFGVNFLDRGRNTFGATGNVNNTAVSYPGGFEISSDPYRSLGLRYVHRFQKGGMLPKAQTGYSWSTNTAQAPKQALSTPKDTNISKTRNSALTAIDIKPGATSEEAPFYGDYQDEMFELKESNTPYIDKLDSMEWDYRFDDWKASKLFKPKSQKTVNLTQGRFNTAKVSESVLDEVVASAIRNRKPVGDLLTLMGRESTFGQQKGKEHRGGSKKELISGWNLAEKYEPYTALRFLADRGVDGIKKINDPLGLYFYPDDENNGTEKIEEYLSKNPKVFEAYQKKLSTTPNSNGKDYFDLAYEFIDEKGIKGYNPGDPDYVNKYQKDYQLLQQDPELQKYLKSRNIPFDKPQKSQVILPNQPRQIMPELKRGGRISKAQTGTAVEGYAPDGTPIYRGGSLREVEVVAQKPKSFRDFTDRYINDLSDRYSTNLFGTLFALPIDAVIGLPQAAATYALSSNKSLVPSEALGIENPYAAFAANAVLDPSNLVGAGLADDAFKFSNRAKNLFRKGFKKPVEVPAQLPGSGNVDFSKYPSQLEAVQARAERLLSQKNKKGWNEQLTPELEERLSTAVQRHDVAGDYPGTSLGTNRSGRTETLVSKDANIKGVPLTESQKSMIAAHETGHYYSNSLKEGIDWQKYFDFSDLPYKTTKYLKGKSNYQNFGNEIRERAAQLKDYIAYKNNIPLNKDFKITRTQLDDALENYVKDTGLDNSMTPFVEALKKKGDISGFLKEMNKRPLALAPAAIIGAGAAIQPKNEPYRNGGKIKPKSSNWEILPEAQGGKQMGIISDPKKDAYYTQPANNNQNIQQEILKQKSANYKGSESNPIQKPEVEIVAKKQLDPSKKAFGTVYPDKTGSSAKLASALFLAPIEKWARTPSTVINYGIGAYKNKDLTFNPYQSEITETLGLKTDPNDLWHSVRNFAINNVADVLVPVEGIAQPGAKFLTNLEKGVAEGAEAYGKSLGATRQIIDNYRNRGQALFATPQTEELLKTVRNVGLSLKNEGDLYNPKVIESVLERAKSLSDSQFKNLTGFEKSELENRLKQLLSGELKKPEVPRVDGMTREEFVRQHLIDLRRPGRRERLQELSLNIGEQNPQGWQNLDNTIQVPGDYDIDRFAFDPNIDITSTRPSYYDIDINRFASEPNMFLQYYENSPNIIDKLNTKLQQTLNKKLNLAEQTELSKESQALIHGIFAREGEAAIRKKLIGAIKRVKGAKKGENFIPSSSLSTDSYPLSYKFLPNLVEEGQVELGYHGMKNLNSLGFSEQIGIPLETNLREINTVIDNINKVSKKKFPYAVIKNNSIDVPVISATKLKLGGKISLKRNKPNTWQILD